MHVARVRRVHKGKEYVSVLLRQSYREGPRVKHRTLASLTALPPAAIEALERSLKGETLVPAGGDGLRIIRSLPHGHVAAVLAMLRGLGLERSLDRRPSRPRDLVVALIVARLLAPASKLATARGLSATTLATELGVEGATEDELYDALDRLHARQPAIERALARRHLTPGGPVLLDVTSTWMEGRCCPLAAHGYSRDHRPDRPQVVFGLLTDGEGCPVAVEAFAGDTADPATLETQVRSCATPSASPSSCSWATGACSHRPASSASARSAASTGSVPCGHRPSGASWRRAACSSRSSTSATSSRSPGPTSPGSASWSAATPCSRRSGPASARRCSRPPRPISRASRRASRRAA